MNPVEVLHDGAAILASILGPSGFAFVETDSGLGSGGQFASGEFRRENRRLELHVRRSLGLVTYHVGKESLSHAELTRAVVATQRLQDLPEYPGFLKPHSTAFATSAPTWSVLAKCSRTAPLTSSLLWLPGLCNIRNPKGSRRFAEAAVARSKR